MNTTPVVVNTATIFQFPKDKIVRENTIEGLQDQILEHKVSFIAYIAERHINSLLNKLAMEGVAVEDEKSVADFVFLVEALRSALYRIHDIEHPLQKFVDVNFSANVETQIVDIMNDQDMMDDEEDEDDVIR